MQKSFATMYRNIKQRHEMNSTTDHREFMKRSKEPFITCAQYPLEQPVQVDGLYQSKI